MVKRIKTRMIDPIARIGTLDPFSSALPILAFFAKTGALPFLPVRREDGLIAFETSICQWVLHWLYLIFPFAVQLALIGNCFAQGIGLDEALSILTIPGLSFMDLLCQVGTSFASALAAFPMSVALTKKRNTFNKVFEDVANLWARLDCPKSINILGKTATRLSGFYAVLGAVYVTLGMVNVVILSGMPFMLSIPISAFNVVVGLTLHSMVFNYLFIHTTDVWIAIMKSWINKMDGPQAQCENADILFDILNCIKDIDDCFGPLLFIDIGLAFVVHIFTLFFLFSSYNIIIAFHRSYLLFLAMMVILQIMITAKFSFLFVRGTALSQEMRNARRSLQDWRMRLNQDSLPEDQKYSLNVLESRLGEHEALKPMGAFTLDSSTSTAAIGLMMTYMVVLLQFKTAS